MRTPAIASPLATVREGSQIEPLRKGAGLAFKQGETRRHGYFFVRARHLKVRGSRSHHSRRMLERLRAPATRPPRLPSPAARPRPRPFRPRSSPRLLTSACSSEMNASRPGRAASPPRPRRDSPSLSAPRGREAAPPDAQRLEHQTAPPPAAPALRVGPAARRPARALLATVGVRWQGRRRALWLVRR